MLLNILRYFKNPWAVALIAGMITIPLLRPCLRHIPDPPPVIGTLPHFELINQEGMSFGSDDLAGQVYLTIFFFTSCPSICPVLTEAMKTLQDRFESWELDVQLLSISVDPVNDDPATIKAYGERYGADFSRWHYLTGEEAAVRSLVVDGFGAAMGVREENEEGLIDISHLGRAVLVDGEGQIRGYYDIAWDENGLDEAFERAQRVVYENIPSNIGGCSNRLSYDQTL